MNRVRLGVADDIPAPGIALPTSRQVKAIRGFVKKALAELGRDKWDIGILLCGDKTIADLNLKYRKKEGATDILSFSNGEGGDFPNPVSRLHGDIVISLETMRGNARAFGITCEEELRRLLLHGILHIDGMDHKTNDNTEPMLRLQEEILRRFSEGRILKGRGLFYGSKM